MPIIINKRLKVKRISRIDVLLNTIGIHKIEKMRSLDNFLILEIGKQKSHFVACLKDKKQANDIYLQIKRKAKESNIFIL